MNSKIGSLARRPRKFFVLERAPLFKDKTGVKTKNVLRSQRSQKPIFEFIWVYRKWIRNALLFFAAPLFPAEYILSEEDHQKSEIIWELTDVDPFNELILSWNGSRVDQESFSFFISLRTQGTWSPWLYYAEWGSFGQQLCKETFPNCLSEVFRGIARSKEGLSDGLRVQVVSPHSGSLLGLRSLYAALSNTTSPPSPAPFEPDSPILLDSAPRCTILQLRLPYAIYEFGASASASVAVNCLSGGVDPLQFINSIYDQDFDCYEHWPLIAAEASHLLGENFAVRIERLADFSSLYAQLKNGCPVVVGIQGTLPEGPRPFYREHGICVIGYDPALNKVHCIDPGFATNKSSFVSYSLEPFLKAWKKRNNIACVFYQLNRGPKQEKIK